MGKIRREINFETADTMPGFEYIPAKVRDDRWKNIFEGSPSGTVIAVRQAIATEASLDTFDVITNYDEHDNYDLSQLSYVLALCALGTAHHTFGTPSKDEYMHRRIRLPTMVDPETKLPTSREELLERTRGGLADAAKLSAQIEEMVRGGRNTYKENQALGRVMATTGVALAGFINPREMQIHDEETAQYEAWKDAREAMHRVGVYTGMIGAVPTMAQLADDQSPLRRTLYDSETLLTARSHGVVVGEINRVAAMKLDALEDLAA